MKPAPVLIIADNYEMARTYARDHHLGREQLGWRYAYDVHHAQGLSPGRYVTLSAGHVDGPALQARIELGRHLHAFGWQYGLPVQEGEPG